MERGKIVSKPQKCYASFPMENYSDGLWECRADRERFSSPRPQLVEAIQKYVEQRIKDRKEKGGEKETEDPSQVLLHLCEEFFTRHFDHLSLKTGEPYNDFVIDDGEGQQRGFIYQKLPEDNDENVTNGYGIVFEDVDGENGEKCLVEYWYRLTNGDPEWQEFIFKDKTTECTPAPKKTLEMIIDCLERAHPDW